MEQDKGESKREAFSRLGWVLIVSQLIVLGVVWGAEQVYRMYLGVRQPELDYVSLLRLLRSNGWTLALGAMAGVVPCYLLHLTPKAGQLAGYLTRVRKKTTPTMVLVCLFLVMGLQNIATLVTLPLEATANAWGWSFVDAYASVAGNAGTISMMVYTVLVAPICEELVYRGFVMRYLEQYGKVFAMIVASLLFGLMHGNIIQLPSALLCGILFGYVALEYSLPASILVHALNNLMAESMTWLQAADEVTAAAVNQAIISFGLVAFLLYVTQWWQPIRGYMRANRTEKGTIWAFVSSLPILLLMAYLVVLTALSIKPI